MHTEAEASVCVLPDIDSPESIFEGLLDMFYVIWKNIKCEIGIELELIVICQRAKYNKGSLSVL